VIQANNICASAGGFDAAWEEARRKAGGIFIAAIVFFLLYVANFAGSLLGSIVGTVAQVVAHFPHLHDSGGLHRRGGRLGGAQASINAARSFPLPTAILALSS